MTTPGVNNIARDLSLPMINWPDTDRFREGYLPPSVISDDIFDNSTCAWVPQVGLHQTPQLSLSDRFSSFGSSHCLMVSISERPDRDTEPIIYSGRASAVKRNGLWVANGIIKTEWWFTLVGGNLDIAPKFVNFAMDIEHAHSSSRGFPRMSWRRFLGNPAVGVIPDPDAAHTWEIIDDDGATVVIPDAESPTNNPPYAGANETKGGPMSYVSLSYDLDAVVSEDGLPGSYDRAFINNKSYDLKSLQNAADTGPVGRGKEPVSVDGYQGDAFGMASFALGMNSIIGISNQSVNNSTHSELMLLRCRVSHYSPIPVEE